MLIFFLKLLLAHLLGDFVLQTRSWVKNRSKNIIYLLLHVLVHALLLSLFFFEDIQESWRLLLTVALSHLAIDSLKIWWEQRRPDKPVLLFAIDQLLHLGVLVAVTFCRFDIIPDFRWLFSEDVLLYLIAVVMVVFVSPVVMRVFFSRWDKEHAFHDKRRETLLDAGLVIGILERAIVVLFIQVGFFAGIGFLIGAKSIFRFGDLTNAKNTKFTEYVLVGTFLSFALAIAIGFGLKWSLGS